jgi:hypothetical protein
VAAPLIGRDSPELEGALPTIWTDCSRADASVVGEDVDTAEPGARGLDDLIDRGIIGQIRLNREHGVYLALLARARRKRLKRLSIAINTSDPDPCRQRPCTMALPMPPAAPVTIATLSISAIACSSLVTRADPISD